MRKLTFAMLLFAGIMSSCSKNQITKDLPDGDNSNLIGVNPAAGLTKAVETTTSSLELDGELYLYAYGEVASNQQNESIKLDFTYSVADGWAQTQFSWDYFNRPISFYSMHDGDKPQELNNIDLSTATLSYTTAESSIDQKDLVYYASTLHAIPVGGKVSAYHYHALSKLNIFASTGASTAYIARVRLVNISSTESATITAGTSNSISWSTPTTQSSAVSYYVDSSDKLAAPFVTSADDVNPMIAAASTSPAIMMIPQTLTANGISGSYIEVIYCLIDEAGAPVVGYKEAQDHPDYALFTTDNTQNCAVADEPLYVKVAFPLGYQFTNNKAHNITLGLGADNTSGGLLLSSNYVDKDGNDIVTGIDTNLPATGEPTFPEASDYIGVTVTAGSWGAGDDMSL